ncbi:MAG: exopolysaccharide biosynthesis polyprenyl glycosylphosphotransferase [Verrucomicrobiota bacterium]
MYSYRLNGGLLVLAGIELMAIGVFLCVAEFTRVALVLDGSVPRPWHMWLPWALGILWEVAWCSAAKRPMQTSVRSATARSVTASIVPGVIWGSWGALLGASGWLSALWVSCFLLLLLLHWMLPGVILKAFFSGQNIQRTVLVGAASQTSRLQSVLQSHGNLGIIPVGWLAGDEECDDIDGIPRWGHVQELEDVVKREGVQQVILAGSPPIGVCPNLLASTCERLGIRLTVAHELQFGFARDVDWQTNGDWCVAAFYREPLQSPINRCTKRAFDILVSVPALVFALIPLLVVTKLAQMLQSPGPLFCRQWRHGRDNRPFRIWKLRTMHTDVTNVSKQAVKGDRRVYPFGRRLRKHSLDELPQFINVLLGDMSVVGPRPHLTEHTSEFSVQRRYQIRSFVKPGITGLAQVSGCRGEVCCPQDLERRVDFDIRYVETWSLLLDLKIMIRTVREVIHPSEAAY